ncbi:LOW QUALITY PROTEIN: hypothetical protein MC885_007496 [Smutsia gigantea]|nr:LOW QUALITY PROTEIN: hypothetical protein MC885_007496 [Smutsia gigantea]
MGDPGSEIIESAPPAGPEASESTTDENEDDIQFVSEGPLRPFLEYIDLVYGDDKETSTYQNCWNEKQALRFTEQYKWVEIKDGKLGCKDCSTVRHLGSKTEKHVHVSKEWIAYLVIPNGSNKTTRQASLWKKIREHDVSKAHGKMQDLLKESINDSISNLVHKQNNKNIDATIKVFNTVYSLVKHNRPLSDIEGITREKWRGQLFKYMIQRNKNSRAYCKRNEDKNILKYYRRECQNLYHN